MSLIRVRRDRKKSWIDTKKGYSLKALIFLLALVGVAIWFISTNY
ncbi:MAG: hypothetical protein WD013_01280 [Gemmatimonadota bacterium]